MENMSIVQYYLVWQHRLNKSGLVLFHPQHSITFFSQSKRLLIGWNKIDNWMVVSKSLDDFHRWNHIAVGRYYYGKITSFSEHIYKHTCSHPYIRLFFFIGLIFKPTILALKLLFLITP